MTPMLSRRRLLSLSAIGGTALLAACTVSTSGGTTTATLDVAQIVTDSKAILSALSAALMAPTLIVALGANYATAEAALLAAQAVLSEIELLTNGSITVTIDRTRLQSLVTTLLADAQTVLALVQGVALKLTGAVATQVGDSIAAVLTLISFVQIAAGLASVRPAVALMTEAQALAVADGTGR